MCSELESEALVQHFIEGLFMGFGSCTEITGMRSSGSKSKRFQLHRVRAAAAAFFSRRIILKMDSQLTSLDIQLANVDGLVLGS